MFLKYNLSNITHLDCNNTKNVPVIYDLFRIILLFEQKQFYWLENMRFNIFWTNLERL